MNLKKSNFWLLSLVLVFALALAACGGSAEEAPAEEPAAAEEAAEDHSEEEMAEEDHSEEEMAEEEMAEEEMAEEEMEEDAMAEAVTIRYALWDANQLPAYEQCAADFMASNENISIEISQLGWGDYWNDIQTGMVAGTAPDVFTNHLANYPEFAANGQIMDIQPMVDADGVDLSIYLGSLADLWARDDARYGLPKDWDTISIVYNADMLEAAGVTVEELNSATWNAEDGGTYEEIVAKLTLDSAGNNGLSADFNKDDVVQYGLIVDAGGAYGQTQWSHYAASNGFSFVEGLYATEYNYDDPAFIATMDWMQSMVVDKGYATPLDTVTSLGGTAMFQAGQGALIADGSWMIGTYASSDFPTGFANLPEGPEGRKSMFNGLADSIYVGTENPAEAWEWVKYLASPDCANTVGDAGVVFPAQSAAVEKALAAYEGRGLDVSSFTDQALAEGGTFLFPVTDNASEIGSIMGEVMDAIFLGQAEPADLLPDANAQVNATFGDAAGSAGEATDAAGLEEGAMAGAYVSTYAGDDATIRYALWDANQLPAYEQCAADFMELNNISIEISQLGWGDYWNDIQTGMVAGTAPDVFTNHLANYPEFAANEQIMNIQPMVEADGLDLSIYLGSLADLWARGDNRYGLPKDWDTISIVYNSDMLEAAGVTVEELNSATWNAEDGGTYEEIIAKLTLDSAGNNGLSADFNKDDVVQYGLIVDAGGAYGQTQWSHYAASNGFSFVEGLYATEYNYDDPAFIATMDWMQSMVVDKGYATPLDTVTSLGGTAMFQAGQGALIADGSWMIGTYASSDFPTGFANLPEGPEGRKSMFNGLADSIYVGTENPEAAWEWVKYLASPDCANTVGDAGVVFPAQSAAVEKALAAYEGRGLDVSSFTDQALAEGGTFLFPVTDNASEIGSIMGEVMDAIFLGAVEPADVLADANAQVNATFGDAAGSAGEATDAAGLDGDAMAGAYVSTYAGDDATIRYALWDANQLPAYEQCAADFMELNNISIEISQLGWGDYWNDIQTGMVAGTAPDVFTNHLANYPEFAANEQIMNIQPMVEADGLDLSIYLEGLADLWARDDNRYGLPKDWDTISVVYNADMLEAAGVTVEELNSATWNAEDGGSYEEIIAKLTLDSAGNNGLSADFDKDDVVQYGLIVDAGGAYGQTQWSHYAASNGFSFVEGLYATEYNYDDPAFIATMDWMQSMVVDKGYATPLDTVTSLGGTAMFQAGQGALIADGSWMIGTYASSDFPTGFANLPEGPEGRKSMFNGLADSIYVGTENPEAAWEWVKYLASPDCANVVGDAGVVFPAQASAVEKALAAYEGRGLDVSSFTGQALLEGGTFLFPVTDNASEIGSIMGEVMDAIFLGAAEPADVLPDANASVNDTFK